MIDIELWFSHQGHSLFLVKVLWSWSPLTMRLTFPDTWNESSIKSKLTKLLRSHMIHDDFWWYYRLGKPSWKKNVFFRALPEKGEGDPCPNFLTLFYTMFSLIFWHQYNVMWYFLVIFNTKIIKLDLVVGALVGSPTLADGSIPLPLQSSD